MSKRNQLKKYFNQQKISEQNWGRTTVCAIFEEYYCIWPNNKQMKNGRARMDLIEKVWSTIK